MKLRLTTITVFISFILLFLPVFSPQSLSEGAIGSSTESDPYVFTTAGVSTSAKSNILMEAESGRVICAFNEKQRLPMASTTKIMTAVLTLELLPMDHIVKVGKETTNIEGSSIYLMPGEQLTVEELLYGLLLRSGNDAANTLAVAACGSVEGFVMLMNLKARELGLDDTHFANPSGLPDKNHYTTAYDLACLASYAIKNESFRTITSTVQKTITNGSRYLVNRNKLLKNYEGLIGIKTGYTPEAGKCLVTAAERNGVTLVAVTLNDGNEWNDHISLLNYGFGKTERIKIASAGEIRSEFTVTNGNTDKVVLSNKKDISLSLPKGSKITVRVPSDIMLYAPIEAGKVTAYAEIYCDGILVLSFPLEAESNVYIRKLNFFERFLQ